MALRLSAVAASTSISDARRYANHANDGCRQATAEQLGISLDRYEEAIEETIDYSDVPPEHRPN